MPGRRPASVRAGSDPPHGERIAYALPVIRFEGTSKYFHRPQGAHTVAVEGLDLEVNRGECLCLIGPSGCGKTTTLRLVNRLVEPEAGRVLVDGRDVAGEDPIELRRRMGYVVQRGGLFPHLTTRQNVGLVGDLEGWDTERLRGRVDELLESVHLSPSEHGERYPAELSGGQRQRVGVARAMLLEPPVVLLDEPFGALDPVTRRGLQKELVRLRGETTMLLVTHDLDEAFMLGDRVAMLDSGRLLQVGTQSDFEERPATPAVRAFLEAQLG